MAHLEKYIASATGHMFAHYDRLHPGKESEIDESRTRLNYNLAEKDQPLSQQDFLKKRLSEIKVLKRADVNVMCDWIVTAPEKLNPNEHEKFFLEVYDFLNERYGKENVISAYVHMDETTPHVHYAFVPVVTDKKKGILKLSAKERITKKDLQTFHPDLTKRMTAVFGRDIGIQNGATVNGNLTPKQMKKLETDMQNFQTVPVEEVTYRIPRAIGEGNVVVKRSELERVNKIASEAQYILENQTALNTQSAEIRKKADHTFTSAEEKREQIISEAESKAAEIISEAENVRAALEIVSENLDERERLVTEREENVSDIEEIKKDCLEKERELEERADSPDRYYRNLYKGKIEQYEKAITEKDNIIAENNKKISRLSSDAKEYSEEFSFELRRNSELEFANKALKEKIAENEKKYKKSLEDKDWECKLSIERNDADRKKFFDDQLAREREYIEELNEIIDNLKFALLKAYRFIRDICMAVSAVVWSKAGTKYHADLPDESETLLKAVSNLGEKVTAEAGFNALSEEIHKSYAVKPSVQKQIDLLEQEYEEQYISELER